MTRAQVSGFTDPLSWGSLLAAIAALALFGLRTVRVDQPFVPPSLFADRVYRTGVLVAFPAMAVNLGGLVFVPLLLVEVDELTPGKGALVMIPAGVVTALLSPWIGRLAGRVDARVLVLCGLGLLGLFSLFLSSFAGGSSVVFAGAGVLGLSIGFTVVMTTVIGAAASALPPDQVGVGLGILQGAQFLGAGTGPAVFGVLVSARQQGGGDAVNPLHSGADGSAYSDVFLAMAAVVVLTLVVASRMRPTTGPGAGTGPKAEAAPAAGPTQQSGNVR
ncbi:MFS transporter [Kitasatospora sp. NPDC058115]|uniref:MFS transporter n=1 Tax=Kitasatospora sp. NPDC058115 TaxID=3346347 RepID=UPI0036DB6FAF